MKRFIILAALYGLNVHGNDCVRFLEKAHSISKWQAFASLAATRDIHRFVDHLEATTGQQNFVMQLPFSHSRVFFLQDPDLVRSVLKAKTSLGFVNHNFDISHRHSRTINTVNLSDDLWRDLHTELTDIFNTTPISNLMEKHKGLLIGDFQYNLNERLEEFFLRVWSEYMFGPIDVAEFQRVRLFWIATLRKVFHTNRLNRLPYIGELTSTMRARQNQESLTAIDADVSKFLRSSIENQHGTFSELYRRLLPKYGEGESFLIARDNSLLGILVYDFVYGVVLDYILQNAKSQASNWRSQLPKSQETAFLYPWRFRVAEEPIGDARVGDYFVINLVRARLPFSCGPRVCSGARLFSEIARKITEIYSGFGVEFANPDEAIVYDQNRDIPIMTSQHEIKLKCPF